MNKPSKKSARLLVLLLALCMALFLAACGGGDSDTEEQAGSASVETGVDESRQGNEADSDEGEATSLSGTKGETLQELLENEDDFMISFVKGVEAQGEGLRCTIEGNDVIVSMPLPLEGATIEEVTHMLDEYFAEEEMASNLRSQIDTIVSMTGIEDVSLSYRYLEEGGTKVLYEKSFRSK